MTLNHRIQLCAIATRLLIGVLACQATVCAAPPDSVLKTVFPAGGQIGTSVDVRVAGDHLDKVETLHVSHSGISVTRGTQDGQFRVMMPADMTPGFYDLRAVGPNGLSSPRTFLVGNRVEKLEAEPQDEAGSLQEISVNTVVNGRIDKKGDVDQYRFEAQQGQRVVIECWAERIDSSLRPVLEILDSRERPLSVSRFNVGLDPTIVFDVPEDGAYVVRLFDLVHSGGAEHVYRLDVDTLPRVVFCFPPVIEQGKTSRVTLFGWNLGGDTTGPLRFDQLQVDITPPALLPSSNLPVLRWPAQVALDGFAYHHPNAPAPVFIGVSDVPITDDAGEHHTAVAAKAIDVPCEVSGQLAAAGETDWYALDVRRGEVLWLEAFGERIGSPVDLDISIFDGSGEHELARFSDELANVGGVHFPSSHLDPAGRWVAPEDGRYVVVVRSLVGTLEDDPRRVYRLSVRREEPDFQLAVVPTFAAGPAGLNVARGGRAVAEVFAFRRRGRTGPIRVRGVDLPDGVECPAVTITAERDSAPLVITASRDAAAYVGALTVVGTADLGGRMIERTARGGVMIRSGVPNGSGRITAQIPLAVAGYAPLRVSAHQRGPQRHVLFGDLQVRVSPGTVVDIPVHVERANAEHASHAAEVQLTGVGLPSWIRNQRATIPAGQDRGVISFYIPPGAPSGPCTIAVRADTTAPAPADVEPAEQKTVPVSGISNAVTFDVIGSSMVLSVDASAPRRIRRGETVKLNYTVERKNGFIGKVHTELDAPEGVRGIRGRGVTFVGQTQSGTIQIIANDDAPLGQQPFLRMWAVGVVEDEPVHHASCFLDLEVVE